MKNTPVYLDYNASAPMRPEARDALSQALDKGGNASSVHGFGREARRLVETAREKVAALCGTMPAQVIFTSGATEANNAVLKAFAGERILVSAIEHPSVLETVPHAERIPVGSDGVIDREAFELLLRQDPAPALVSIMLVNNETGVIQPVRDLTKRARALHPNVFIHTDAVQAAGRMAIDFPALHADYLSLSAHKCGGPQGVGALVVAPGARPAVLLHGGGQEKRQRAGTENVAAIAGFGAAAEGAASLEGLEKMTAWRDKVEQAIGKIEPRAVVPGNTAPRVANTSCIALPGIPAETQLMILDMEGVAVSSGSACSSGTVKVSHVLKAMGIDDDIAKSAIRISTGWAAADEDIDRFIAAWTVMHGRVKDRIRTANGRE